MREGGYFILFYYYLLDYIYIFSSLYYWEAYGVEKIVKKYVSVNNNKLACGLNLLCCR